MSKTAIGGIVGGCAAVVAIGAAVFASRISKKPSEKQPLKGKPETEKNVELASLSVPDPSQQLAKVEV